MKESRRTLLSVLGIYAAGSWVVLQVIDVLNQNVGLPPWAFSLALTFLLIGLPVVGATAWLQGRAQNDGAAAAEDPPGSPTGPHKLFTWRNGVTSRPARTRILHRQVPMDRQASSRSGRGRRALPWKAGESNR